MKTEVFSAVTLNGLDPAALEMAGNTAKEKLAPDAWSAEDLGIISYPGEKGRLFRLFLQYAVSCALDADQEIPITWKDDAGEQHNESLQGKHGLAPSWAYGPLDEEGQLWVSACLAARTNWSGKEIPISLRGPIDALTVTQDESEVYSNDEGAFWGNLFTTTPVAWACHDGPQDGENAVYARSQHRECAAGHVSGTGTIEPCGIIDIVGSCDAMCDTAISDASYHTGCGPAGAGLFSPEKTKYVISVALP